MVQKDSKIHNIPSTIKTTNMTGIEKDGEKKVFQEEKKMLNSLLEMYQFTESTFMAISPSPLAQGRLFLYRYLKWQVIRGRCLSASVTPTILYLGRTESSATGITSYFLSCMKYFFHISSFLQYIRKWIQAIPRTHQFLES